MSQRIKVSIIVPVYKTEAYLEKCLDSLVNQTLNEIEIIVVNDGSPDNSQDIIDEYAKKYPEKVRAYIKENGGLSDARNYGLDFVNGEFVTFVDSDDYVELETYEKTYNYAKENNLDIVCFGGTMIYPDSEQKLSADSEKLENEFNYLLSLPSACFKISKAEIWKKNNLKFAVGLYYEDLELMPRLVLYTDKIGLLDEQFYNYIVREESIMNQVSYNPKLRSIFEVMKSLRENIQDKRYREQIEYIHIAQLLHVATLRFLPFEEGKKDILEIADVMRKEFPKWYKNRYFKRLFDYKRKIACFLVYFKQVSLLRKLIKQ